MQACRDSKSFGPIAHAITAAVLLCVCASLFYFPQVSSAAANETYCPLQKRWVNRYTPQPATTAQQRELLKDICARDDRKSLFLANFIQTLRFIKSKPTNVQVSKAFFAYFTGGKIALNSFVLSGNAPEPELVTLSPNEKSAASGRLEIADLPGKIFFPVILPRPPVKTADNFVRPFPFEIYRLSRRVQPRAPPVSSDLS
jgi:hypothetical protein